MIPEIEWLEGSAVAFFGLGHSYWPGKFRADFMDES